MAARRLLIVMLILLGLSTLAAALIPTESLRDDTTETATEPSESEPTQTEPRGRRLRSVIVVKPKLTARVPVEVGDQLSLVVCSGEPDQVEIAALGLIQTVLPQAPARFDLIATSRGTYGVRLIEADRLIGRIDIAPVDSRTGSESPKLRLSREQRRCDALAGGTAR